MPERDLKKFKSKEKKQKDTENSIIDGPKDVVNAQNRLYTIAASKDTGFQGYEPKVRKTYQPKKSLAKSN